MRNKTKQPHKNFWLAMLGIMGLPSCIPILAEYGSPSALFKINGTVKNAQTEQPIKGIKVVMLRQYERSDTSAVHGKPSIYPLDSINTNDKGEFSLKGYDFPSDQKFTIQLIDIDGEANGTYENFDTIVSFVDPDFKHGDNDWYSGETTEKIDVNLKPL